VGHLLKCLSFTNPATWNSGTKSLEKFDAILINFKKFKDIYKLAGEERKATLEMFSRDSGEESQEVIKDARALACNKDPVESELINYLKKEPGKVIGCGTITIPANLEATVPGTLRYVVFREEKTKTIETCDYEAGHSLIRIQYYSIITVNNVQTGRKYSTTSLYGYSPSSCTNIHSFPFGSFVDYEYGGRVTDKQIGDWLEKVIK